MSTIVTRTGKGSTLTYAEGDANFTNLNNDKAEKADLASNANGEGASLIGIEDASGIVTATTVEGAIQEDVANLNSHLADATAAHAASAISNTPTGAIAATDVQAAINELDTEKQPIDATLTALSALGTAADKIPYTTGVDTWAETGIDVAGRSIINGNGALVFASKSAAVTYITANGIVNGANYYITSSDGGHFVGVTGASASTYTDDGGSHCGTQFIPTGGDGTSGIVRFNKKYITPEMFGASQSESIDSTGALLACIASAKANSYLIEGTLGARYKTTSSLWFGSDSTANTVRGYKSNGAVIVAYFNNAPVVDLTGIQNGNRDDYDIRITTASGYYPSYGVLNARPKQAVGVVSSGNTRLYLNITGNYLASGYCSIESESNVNRESLIQNDFGLPVALISTDYFYNTFVLPFDAKTSNFTIGDTLTGSTSGATATIHRISGTALFCLKIAGTFVDNETITDTGGGSATSNIPTGYTVIGIASPNTTLGIEEASTSTFQKLDSVWMNNNSGDELFPALLIRNFQSVIQDSCNYNHSSTSGDMVHVTGVGVDALKIRSPYWHATHRYSLVIGEDIATSQTYDNFEVREVLSVGTFTARIKVLGTSTLLQNPVFYVDGDIDLGSARAEGACSFSMLSRPGSTFTCSGSALEGRLECLDDSTISITTPTSGDQLTIFYSNTGLYRYPPRGSATISVRNITINRRIVLVTAPSAALDDTYIETINISNSALLDGETIYLRAATVTNIPQIRISGGNIRGAANVLLDSTVKWVPLVFDKSANLFYIPQIS